MERFRGSFDNYFHEPPDRHGDTSTKIDTRESGSVLLRVDHDRLGDGAIDGIHRLRRYDRGH